MIRHDWTLQEFKSFYALPLLQLLSSAHQIHVLHHAPHEVQCCHLISIKTGGCPEDCRYCAQSSRYQTPLSATPMMEEEEVISRAKEAAKNGASRICLGAAWREVRESLQFESVLRMVKGIAEMGLEVCCTLGMLNADQAARLKEAGLYAYNHNLDTSSGFYKTIITTRTYQERLKTLDTVQSANITLCCGGILGLGESVEDRLELLLTLSNRPQHPESVPINLLTAVPGTPLEGQPRVPLWEMLRVIAIARIAMPKAKLRLSAGRKEIGFEGHALLFLAGANSIFIGEKLLTVANTSLDRDEEMIALLGIERK